MRNWFCVAIVVNVVTPVAVCAADPTRRDAEALFARDVLPLLKQKCFVCHGDDPQDVRGELDMRSRSGLLKGGESGEPALVPGKPQSSPLYLAATRQADLYSAMPPKENDKLTDQQLAHLESWIAGGAPWPSDERIAELRAKPETWDNAEGVAVATSGGLSDEWTNRRYEPENLWAYQPLRREPPPFAGEQQSPIDAFINARLQELRLEAAPPAGRRALIRRATFDLIGLPPTPAEIEAFVADPAGDDVAFAKVVERLLDSPHYGEQWGRHWLDVVRYADSSGFANDYERGNAWRYRDYVVRAFNSDKPYDEFIREQIAGDEIDPEDPEMLVAAGFLRMGPWELTGMEVAQVARQRFLDDVTNVVGQVFLGHMLRCARCHDHKFDPVPTRDYYAIQAAFATTQLAERRAPFLPRENTSGFGERKYLEQRRRYYQQQLSELNKKHTIAAARAWLAEHGRDPEPFERVLAELESERDSKRSKNGPVSVGEIRRRMAKQDVPPDLIPPRHVGFSPQDFGLERVARKGLQRLAWRFERYEPFALSVYSGRTPNLRSVYQPLRVPEKPLMQGELEQTAILAGGDTFSPTKPVEPGVLSVVGVDDPIEADVVGRRIALADWIANPENPLTARVMVNRIWQWHFGKPLAGNPNNFGATGKKPTHPKLLDWLAASFIEGGWSVKQMHRLIMHSAAYRRSTRYPHPEKLAKRDPNRESYAAFLPRRLDAEELRDAMLAVSGELNRELGGIPVRPEMNLEAALQPRMVMGTFAEAWQPSPLPSQRRRRSLYALRIRGQRDPFFEVFNAPGSEVSCEARESSTVTPQVFAMFNSEITFDRALALADRLLEETDSRQAALRRAFELAYGRPASRDEVAACLAHWQAMTDRHEQLDFDAPTYPQEVVREAVEENTGEQFTFTEPLEVYADFVPDLKPADASPRLRGLAEVCLVLLNSNEFAYVY